MGRLRYAPNLSIMFTELPLLDRPAAAAATGFDAVEFWWPFADAVPPATEVDAFVNAVSDAGTTLIALNCFAGDMASGERGALSIPARSEEFTASLDVLVDIGTRTRCLRFNALYGQRVGGVAPDQQDALATANLARIAQAIAGIGGTVLVEALTAGENGAYPLKTSADVFAVVDRVTRTAGIDNIAMLADIYHLTNNGEDLYALFSTSLDRIRHIQLADAPGRHEPGTGEIDVDGLLGTLIDCGYQGYISLEYRPLGDTAAGLAWLPPAQRATAVTAAEGGA